MKELVLRWFILTVGITIAAYLIDGIQVSGFFSALFTAAILGILIRDEESKSLACFYDLDSDYRIPIK